MWNRHDAIPHTRWDDYVHLIRTHVPRPEQALQLPPITVTQWIAAVRRKKTTTACGPDGVTRLDLLRMPAQHQAILVEHINLLDQGILPWHPSTLTGLVALVEKKDNAAVPQDFRPICVLSVIYRTWSSIRAQQCLRFLDTIAPSAQYGNRPGVSAKHIWWGIAQSLELDHLEGKDTSGIITDIIKCFNTLPRFPIAFVARWLNFPQPFVAGWFHAVSAISRRFVAAGAVSRGIQSTTGFAEGDPLSVVGMALYNITMHWILSAQQPTVQFISFVDNWEAVCQDFNEVPDVAAALTAFARQTDVQLDARKTETWSLSAIGRKHLRQGHFGTVLATRDLGGQMVYCKRHVITQLRQRITKHAVFWNWMRRSHAPASFKMRMLHTVAWPRILHGISNLHLGQDHFVKLRAAAMQAMQWTKKGASSTIQFSLNRDLRADPSYYSLDTTIKDFRLLRDPVKAFHVLDTLAMSAKLTSAQGPCSALLTRLQQLGWRWEGNGYVTDHESLEWHLVDSPLQWVSLRLKQGWALQVGGQMSTRKTFEGLQSVDLQCTHDKVEALSPEGQGFLRCVQNGTFYTRDMQYFTGKVVDQKCPWCADKDGVYHHNWVCPHFHKCRQHVPADLMYEILQEPPCFHLRAWVVESPDHALLRRLMHKLPDTMSDHVHSPTDLGELHLFTDGSCLTPAQPVTRLATWAVCLGRLDHLDFPTVASGVVPGGIHTTLRGEICAAIAAARYGNAVQKPYTIWTDNQTVFHELRKILEGTSRPSGPMRTNHDLWNALRQAIEIGIQKGRFRNVIKVRSHEDETQYPEAVEKWAIHGNEAADAAAEAARDQVSPALMHTRERVVRRQALQVRMRDAMRKMLIAIGFASVNQKPDLKEAVEQAWDAALAKPRVCDESQLSLTQMPASLQLPRKHSLGEHAQVLFDWMSRLTGDGTGEPMWLSSHQLLVHFQTHMSHRGFQFNQRTNRWDAILDDEASTYEFHKGAMLFRQRSNVWLE